MPANVKRKVLGVVGSPRSGGNTDTMVEAILAGAESEGAEVIKVTLGDLRIAPCHSCNSCQQEGRCMHKDDMVELERLMDDCDVWVLGTPVYWWSVSAQMKAFIDRWYAFDHRLFGNKEIILAIPMGGSDKVYARHILGMFKSIFSYLNMSLVGTIVAAGMTGKNSARERITLLDEARNIGRSAVNDSAGSSERPYRVEYST